MESSGVLKTIIKKVGGHIIKADFRIGWKDFVIVSPESHLGSSLQYQGSKTNTDPALYPDAELSS